MAEYSEVMRQRERMCESIKCEECELNEGTYSINCHAILHTQPNKAEKVIMQWAEDHPEIADMESYNKGIRVMRNKIIRILMEGENTIIGRRITIERIYDCVVEAGRRAE